MHSTARLSLAAALALGSVVAARAAEVTVLEAPVVEAAFARGVPLLETADYKVHASRREAPGQAEVHERDSDIVYVLRGRATLVTGGEVVDGRTVAAEEIRGEAIRGGDTRELGPGDVVVVPDGVPHQFTALSNPFLYYVVKVPTGSKEAR